MTRSGQPTGHHDAPPGDPYWQRYISGQLDLARLSAAEVARKLRLPGDPRSLLDIGGGHGWYSAELCRRYPQLTATVFDLPGSAAIGREIIALAGMADRVRYRDGDATADDLGSGYDGVLCFNLVHHLTPTRSSASSARSMRRSRLAGCWPLWTPSPSRAAARRPPRTSSGCSSTSAPGPKCIRRAAVWLAPPG